MRRYTYMHGLEVQDNGKTVNKLTVQATITENENGCNREARKVENLFVEMVDNYMKDSE